MWFEYYAKIKVRVSSHKTYEGYIKNHIKPNIGTIPLIKLTTLDLQMMYQKLLTGGRVDRLESQNQPKGLSAKALRNLNQIISSAMKLAMEQKLIAHNPADGCALPRVEHREMKTGTYEMYYLGLATGMRRGDLLGLKWEDIDFDHGVIHIRSQIARLNGTVQEAPLKTKNSYRNISIGADAVELLKQKKEQDNGKSVYVFPSPTGGPLAPDSVLHMLHRVLERAGLPKMRFHDLRHTFATLALQNGVDIKTVSGMLGHFLAGFTLDTYAHMTTAAQREAAETMDSVLSP